MIRSHSRLAVRIALASVSLLATLGVLTLSATPAAAASSTVPTCFASQLSLSTDSGHGAYNAAGNEGVAFIFVNISSAACTLMGYPRLHFSPSSFRGRRTTISHNGGSEIFATVTPRLVVVAPGGSASFGLNYGDAYNQSEPYAGRLCTTKSAAVSLPVDPNPYSVPWTTPLSVNFCFANFHFGVTSLQRGRVPKKF